MLVVVLFVMILVVLLGVAATAIGAHAGIAAAEDGHASHEGGGGEDELSNLGHDSHIATRVPRLSRHLVRRARKES